MTALEPMVRMIAIVNDGFLETTYTWLCKRRQDYPPDADCWRFRRDWLVEKARLQAELLAGTYDIGFAWLGYHLGALRGAYWPAL